MAINLEGINNLYSERYIVTLDIIEGLHKMIESDDYREIIDNYEKLAPYALNQKLAELDEEH